MKEMKLLILSLLVLFAIPVVLGYSTYCVVLSNNTICFNSTGVYGANITADYINASNVLNAPWILVGNNNLTYYYTKSQSDSRFYPMASNPYNYINTTSADLNNYTLAVSVTGSGTKTLQLSRDGMSNISASWTDLDTDSDTTYSNGTGLTLSGTTFSITKPYFDSLYASLSKFNDLYVNVSGLQSQNTSVYNYLNGLYTNVSNLQTFQGNMYINVSNLQSSSSAYYMNISNLQIITNSLNNSLISNTTLINAVNTNLGTNATKLNTEIADRISNDSLYYLASNPNNYVNTTIADTNDTNRLILEENNRATNDSVLSGRIDSVNSTAVGKASVGTCGTGMVVQNTTTSGVQCVNITMNNTGVVASTYGSASIIPVIKVDAQGRVLTVTNTTATGDIAGITTASTSGLQGGCTSSTCTLVVNRTDLNNNYNQSNGLTSINNSLNIDISNLASNKTIWDAKAGTGTCTGNQVVQNTTTSGVQCITVSSTDLNNYSTGLSVTGTSTKTIQISRTGMSNISGTFTDIDTNDGTGGWTNTSTTTSTGLNVSMNSVLKLDGGSTLSYPNITAGINPDGEKSMTFRSTQSADFYLGASGYLNVYNRSGSWIAYVSESDGAIFTRNYGSSLNWWSATQNVSSIDVLANGLYTNVTNLQSTSSGYYTNVTNLQSTTAGLYTNVSLKLDKSGTLNRSQVVNNFAFCPDGSAQYGENETGRYCDATFLNSTDLASVGNWSAAQTGTYDNITTLQTFRNNIYTNVTNLQTFQGNIYTNVTTLQSLTVGIYNNVTTLQGMNPYSNITALQSLTSGIYTNVTNLQSLTSGMYTNVTALQTFKDNIYINVTGVNTTATAALPKSGGTMTGAINMGGNNLTANTGVYSYANTSCYFFVTPTMNVSIGC